MLEVEHLAVSYGPTRILEDVSFTVPARRVVALLGGNGSGKTTVLNALSGMVRPRAGAVRIAGTDCAGRRPDEILRRGVAQVPQGREVFATMTVAENLEMGAFTRRDPDGVRRDREHVLALFPRLREKARRRAACAAKPRAGSRNCGTKATKKAIDFGLSAVTTKASRAARRGGSGGAAAAATGARQSRSPSQAR